MGNTPLTIAVKVDSGNNGGAIVAGSILNGRIYLNNQEPVDAHSIRLKMIGTEEVVVHYTKHHTNTDRTSGSRNGNRNGHCHRNHNHTCGHSERASHTFYNIDHSIKDFPGGIIPRGQYEFPFALQLPKSLPSSMDAQRKKSKCKVRYEVVAEVFKKPNSRFYSNPHAKEKVNVVAMPSSSSVRSDSSLHLPVEIVPISTCNCCCFMGCTKVGTMALEAQFDKTTVLMDGLSSPSHRRGPCINKRNTRQFQSLYSIDTSKSIGVKFRCENRSTEKIKSIKAELIETIEFSANGRTEIIKTTLASSTLNDGMYPELDANSNNIDHTERLLSKPWRTIHPSLRVEADMATDTYRGRAIQVRHVLSVKVVMDGCCSTNPDASALVEIYRNPAAFGVDVASNGKQQQQQTAHPPSFDPLEDEGYAAVPVQATAPPSSSDNKDNNNVASEVPLAEAQLVLPEGWNAQTAEIVTIAETTVVATLVDSSAVDKRL